MSKAKARVAAFEAAARERGALGLLAPAIGSISVGVGAEDWAGATDGRAHPGGVVFGALMLLLCILLLRSSRRLSAEAERERYTDL